MARIDWTRDELLLACALVVHNGWRELRQGDASVLELSDLLRSLPTNQDAAGDPRFRSPNSVSRKTTDIATAHPDHEAPPREAASQRGMSSMSSWDTRQRCWLPVNHPGLKGPGLAQRAPLAVVLRLRPVPRPVFGGGSGAVDCAPRRHNSSARWRMLREPFQSACATTPQD
ncbi:hypothetical protein ACWCOW_32165, partial [Streptomyces sp. NPDC001939]